MRSRRSILHQLKPQDTAERLFLIPLLLLLALATFVPAAFGLFSGSFLGNATWSGGQLVLTQITDEESRPSRGRCTIRPQEGPERTVSVPASYTLDRDYVALQPWFDGSAEVSCGHGVYAFTGWRASLAVVFQNRVTPTARSSAWPS